MGAEPRQRKRWHIKNSASVDLTSVQLETHLPMAVAAPTAQTARLVDSLSQRILMLDGGMGTMLQNAALSEEEFRGERFKDWPSDVKGNNDLLVLTCPDLVSRIHRDYLLAGADILETNTFNATRLSQSDYGMEALVPELNREAARLPARSVMRSRRTLGSSLCRRCTGPDVADGVPVSRRE